MKNYAKYTPLNQLIIDTKMEVYHELISNTKYSSHNAAKILNDVSKYWKERPRIRVIVRFKNGETIYKYSINSINIGRSVYKDGKWNVKYKRKKLRLLKKKFSNTKFFIDKISNLQN